jgi:hypothetical protein
MPSRRLEDRIRELCSKCVNAKDTAELEPAVEKLKTALRQHTSRLRELAARKLVQKA